MRKCLLGFLLFIFSVDLSATVTTIKPGKRVNAVLPAYPKSALVEKISGRVVLEILINEKGDVSEVKVLNSNNPLLSNAATKAVRQWKYELTKINGAPIKVVWLVNVDFVFAND